MDLPQAVSRKGGGISMKKGWKIFWIVCAVTAAIGFVCCVIAKVLGVTTDMIEGRFPHGIGVFSHNYTVDDYINDDDDIPLASDMKNSYSNIAEMDVDIFAGQVKVVLSDDAKDVMVETRGINKRLGLKCYQDGDELKIKSKERIWHVNNVGSGTITITLPRDLRLNEASFDIGAGTLDIEKIFAQDLYVGVGAGDANITHFEAGEVEFDCGAGSIRANGDARSKIDIDGGVGEVILTVAGEESSYNYDIDCKVGEVICGNTTYSGLANEKNIDNGASRDITVDCGVGTITINFENAL